MKDLISNKNEDKGSTSDLTQTSTKKSSTNSTNTAAVLNQHHTNIPCFNNINIYTNGLNNIKGDVTLRQYIFNKVNKKGIIPSSKLTKAALMRANSSSGI